MRRFGCDETADAAHQAAAEGRDSMETVPKRHRLSWRSAFAAFAVAMLIAIVVSVACFGASPAYAKGNTGTDANGQSSWNHIVSINSDDDGQSSNKINYRPLGIACIALGAFLVYSGARTRK